MGTNRVQKSKGAVTSQKYTEFNRIENLGKYAKKGHSPTKKMGDVSLVTRIKNDFLATVYDKDVDGLGCFKKLPKQGNRGIREYVSHIVTLIKTNGDKHSPTIEINITTAEAEAKKTANDRLSQVLSVDSR